MPPSTRRAVPCAIELVPTMPRSWPVAAKIAAIAEAGVNATDCMPDATAPCVPANESSSRASTLVPSTPRPASSGSGTPARTALPCPPRPKEGGDGLGGSDREGLRARGARPGRPGEGELERVAARRPRPPPHGVVGERHLCQNRLAVPAALEVAVRRLLVAAHVCLQDRALRLHR